MARERAKSFADRLPTVVPREEQDISHLSDEMADILYPGRRPRPFRMGIRFAAWQDEGGRRAVELARRASLHREEPGGTHHAEFEVDAARLSRELFHLVQGRPGTEVLVDGKRPPYAQELWLPLFWVFVGGEEGLG
jgi:hypothetical protein